MIAPPVSVVMSVFNGEAFLAEAIESVLRQDFEDFEFIVIDDGSVDASLSILKDIAARDSRLIVHSQANRGLIESLNRGCAAARGRYIARMDADDISLSQRLSLQFAYLEANPAVAVVGGAIECIDSAGAFIGTDLLVLESDAIATSLLKGHCPLVHPTVLFRKQVFNAVGGYRSCVVDAEDYDLWLRISDRHRLANLERAVLKYRRHANQISTRRFRQQAMSNLAARAATRARRSGAPDPLTGVATISPEILDQLGVSKSSQSAAIARAYLTCAGSLCDARDYDRAEVILRELASDRAVVATPANLTADHGLLLARLHWRRHRPLRSARALLSGITAYPPLLARPLKRWIGGLR